MIELVDVSIVFNLAAERISSFKEYLVKLVTGKLKYTEFTALSGICLNISKGDILGIIGNNGAGKSTLLKIIAQVLKPTSGTVSVQGKIAPMLELGAGFDFELTARENVYLNGAILGYKEQFINEKYDEIVEFSELGDFMNVPIRNFSSGMIARLAFAIATLVVPEILIVDEVLSVGDEGFRRKSEEKMSQMMSKGTTVIFVSHSIDQVEELCSRVLWLEKGKIKMIGEPKQVCAEYLKTFQ